MKVTILPGGQWIDVPAGTLLRQALLQAGRPVDAPCGGNGSCGKCRVLLDGAPVLACQTAVCADCTVTLPETSVAILTDGATRSVAVAPPAEWAPGDCVAAADIGTTTVVVYLLDAHSGAQLATASALNPQAAYGADVISRIQAALDGQLDALRDSIRRCLNELLRDACRQAAVPPERVRTLTAVGNTAMHHLLLGLSPASLGVAPYQPLVAEALVQPAAPLGLQMHPQGQLQTLPCIAGFVGADTVAVALSQELDTLDELTLLLDLGTNGELILGDRHRAVACSTAAGPAFEGANIRFGMRCVPGAIDHARWDGQSLQLHTAGEAPVCGLCGSGLLDLVAAGLDAGLIDGSGRLKTAAEAPALAHLLATIDGEACLRLAPGDDPVRLTQRDIREVQLAKAAVAAGIELLCDRLGVAVDDIHQVRIAGAFGSFLNPEAALTIGLLPRALAGRIRAIGNAAGAGACCAALSPAEFRRASAITRGIAFVELASSPAFQDCFVDHIRFGEEDDDDD